MIKIKSKTSAFIHLIRLNRIRVFNTSPAHFMAHWHTDYLFYVLPQILVRTNFPLPSVGGQRGRPVGAGVVDADADARAGRVRARAPRAARLARPPPLRAYLCRLVAASLHRWRPHRLRQSILVYAHWWLVTLAMTHRWR